MGTVSAGLSQDAAKRKRKLNNRRAGRRRLCLWQGIAGNRCGASRQCGRARLKSSGRVTIY